MSRRERDRRDARLDQLGRRANLTDAEREEYDKLQAWRDNIWRRLPERIARIRADLAELENYANEIGLGPC